MDLHTDVFLAGQAERTCEKSLAPLRSDVALADGWFETRLL